MVSASLVQEMSLTAWASVVYPLVIATAIWLWLCSTAAHSNPAQSWPISEGSTQTTRGVRLFQVNPELDETQTDVDIIAIHGLNTKSPDTWTWRRQKSLQAPLGRANQPEEDGVNWLQDPRMLPAKVGSARIFTCDWPAELLQPVNLVQKRIDEYARLLLDGIQRQLSAENSAGKDRPLFFIASCLGGIILIQALVHANNEQSNYLPLRRATRGIVFLATPFHGTSFKDVAAWAEPSLKAWASFRGRKMSKLLEAVKGPTFDLDFLVRQFTQLCLDKKHPCDVFTFYELGLTSLPGKVLPWLPVSLRREKLVSFVKPQSLVLADLCKLVDSFSANLQIVPEPLSLDRPHVLTNKFEKPECKDYEKVAGKIEDLLRKIREGSPLKQADAWIRDKHYIQDRLQIERLSGVLLPMEQCFINLAIVEQARKTEDRLQDGSEVTGIAPKSSPFSLHTRLGVETPSKAIQVQLSTIFNPRERNGGEITPRRILIRGRAGVGKTTLCKKVVHDFTRHGTWGTLFDRILWVPLRNLKERSQPGYNLGLLFEHEYFWNRPERRGGLIDALSCATEDGRTLFVLDGLDEVSDLLDPDHVMSRFLESLLNQSNVIITTRPYATLPQTLAALDLELETVGFYPNQVKEYLQIILRDSQKAHQIWSFLQGRPLMKDLVCIPVQLDALCFVWTEGFESEADLDTMTGIYRAIEQKLWKKDVPRLDKTHDGKLVRKNQLRNSGIEAFIEQESCFLDGLAFTTLHNDVINFEPKLLNEAFARFAPSLLVDKTIPGLSFLRTSPSPTGIRQNCHFLHLTYQEYFAARYFVRQWKASPSKRLRLNSRGSDDTDPTPIEYLRMYKYTARYDILWRFVAGLLDTDGRVKDFFNVIEEEPLDLLGCTHQWLIIHCLSEVAQPPSSEPPPSSFASLQRKLEDHLVIWLLFECQSQRQCFMAGEAELPPQVLCQALQDANDEGRMKLVRGMRIRHSVPSTVADLLISFLKSDTPNQLKVSILDILGRHSQALDGVLQHIVARLNDSDGYVRRATVEALAAQGQLPDEVLQHIAARLNDSDADVREAAVEALLSRTNLPIKIIAPYLKTLYRLLFDDNWRVNICWPTSISESYLQVNQSGLVRWSGWTEHFVLVIREIAGDLGVPLESKGYVRV
jgi:hypothetical protein